MATLRNMADLIRPTREVREIKPTRESNMNTLHVKALNNAIKLLNAIGAKYAVLDSDGIVHGDLEVKKKSMMPKTKAKRRALRYPFGAVVKYVKPYIDITEVNSTTYIPVAPLDLETVYRSASAIACKEWGNGSHKVGTSKDKQTVILTRHEIMDDFDQLLMDLSASRSNGKGNHDSV
jgi:hypothetical protein